MEFRILNSENLFRDSVLRQVEFEVQDPESWCQQKQGSGFRIRSSKFDIQRQPLELLFVCMHQFCLVSGFVYRVSIQPNLAGCCQFEPACHSFDFVVVFPTEIGVQLHWLTLCEYYPHCHEPGHSIN